MQKRIDELRQEQHLIQLLLLKALQDTMVLEEIATNIDQAVTGLLQREQQNQAELDMLCRAN